MTVHVIGLGAGEKVQYMDIIECIAVACSSTEVPAFESVRFALEHTADRKDGDLISVRMVRIPVKERVVIPYVRSTQLSISKSLVGGILDVMLLGSRGRLGSGENAEFKTFCRLELKFALDTEFIDVNVKIVVIQLVDNIERRIITGIEHIRIESPGCIQSVRIRVDIEITLYLARNGINLCIQSSRSPLCTMRTVTDYIQRQLVGNLIGRIEVEGISVDITLQRPSCIIEKGERSVEIQLFSTAGKADRMIVLDIICKQPVEPVGIPVLSSTEISNLGLVSILETELA